MLQAFNGIHPERMWLNHLNDNLPCRWLVGLSLEDPIWNSTTVTTSRERFLNDAVMGLFPEKLMGAREVEPLFCNEDHSVGSNLRQAWASHDSLERLDGEDD